MKKYLAEVIGTFTLVLLGCGSAVIAGDYIGFAGISFAFGLALLAMAYAIGHVSGCHINPAVSISMLVAGRISGKDTVGYIIAQCLGAILGAAVLMAIASGVDGYDLASDGLGQNGYGEHSPAGYDMASAFVAAEVVLTALFLFVIHGASCSDVPAGFAALPVGLSLVVIHLVGIPITGTSVNPARSLGPAVFVGGDAIQQLWLFWAAPVLGGILSGALWRYVFEKRTMVVVSDPPKEKVY
jgi:aquaporin Z